MSTWERRVIGILTLGGSFLGLVLGISLFISQGSWIAKALCIPFLALYGWGISCGMQLLESQQRAIAQAAWFWALQVPYFMSPVAGYMFTSGSFATFTYQPSTSDFNFLYLFGSKFEYSLLQADKPLTFGINLFAMAVLTLIIYRRANPPPNNSFKPTPLRGAA